MFQSGRHFHTDHMFQIIHSPWHTPRMVGTGRGSMTTAAAAANAQLAKPIRSKRVYVSGLRDTQGMILGGRNRHDHLPTNKEGHQCRCRTRLVIPRPQSSTLPQPVDVQFSGRRNGQGMVGGTGNGHGGRTVR